MKVHLNKSVSKKVIYTKMYHFCYFTTFYDYAIEVILCYNFMSPWQSHNMGSYSELFPTHIWQPHVGSVETNRGGFCIDTLQE